MDDRITIGDFALAAQVAATKYPGAKVVSVGTGSKGDLWYYGLFLKVDGQEVRFEIPAYREKEAERNDTRFCI